MKITYSPKVLAMCDPENYPGGTIFRAVNEAGDIPIVVVKVHSTLYVRLGGVSHPLQRDFTAYNPKWYSGWLNPEVIKAGESFTVSV